jgi:hypothetical protein
MTFVQAQANKVLDLTLGTSTPTMFTGAAKIRLTTTAPTATTAGTELTGTGYTTGGIDDRVQRSVRRFGDRADLDDLVDEHLRRHLVDRRDRDLGLRRHAAALALGHLDGPADQRAQTGDLPGFRCRPHPSR